MASIQLKLSTKADSITGKSEIHIRFSHGRNIDLRAQSKIFIPLEYWNKSTSTIIVPKFRLMTPQQRALVDDLTLQRDNPAQLQLAIGKAFIEASSLEDVTPDWLNTQIELFHHPEKCKPQEPGVADIDKLDDEMKKELVDLLQ